MPKVAPGDSMTIFKEKRSKFKNREENKWKIQLFFG